MRGFTYFARMKIEIISGSPRLGSLTQRVALHLFTALKAREDVDPGLILMNETAIPPIQKVWSRAADAPENLRPIAERIFNAQGYIIVTPEYNGGYSPAMKNLFDHFPKRIRKPFGICTASNGMMGGMRASQQMLQLVPALFGIASPTLLIVPEVDKKFDEEGNLLVPAFQKNINDFIADFLWLATRLK